MKSSHVPAGFFVMRTPLLAFEEARTGLRELVARPEVRDALFLASPSLDERVERWLGADQGDANVERSLVRYVTRMSARATPFGLFAGCSLGVTGETTRLGLSARASYRRSTRVDMDYLTALAEAAAREPRLRAELVYRPSSSLYRAAGRLRYVEARAGEHGVRTHHLVAIEPTELLDATLARAEHGARLDVLVAAVLADDPDVSASDAAAFVAELVDGQILVPDLEPAVTGDAPIADFLTTLRRTGAPDYAAALAATCEALDAVDRDGLGASPERYRDAARPLEALPATPELAHLFQVDLMKDGEVSLGPNVTDELLRGAELLRRIAFRRHAGLERFRAAFVARWGERSVPLTEALDEESGIGFEVSASPGATSPLLATIAFPGEPSDDGSTPQAHLVRRLGETLGSGARLLELSDADLEKLARPDAPPLPPAFSVIASLAAVSDDAVAAGRFRVMLEGVSSPSGAHLLARFCHADRALAARVRELVAREEADRPDAVHAEVVHLPEGRAGNVLLRPVLRRYEIGYLARSGGERLALDDLFVSVEGERIVIRSERLGREIVPRLTHALDFAVRGLGVVRFLGALQYQGVASGLGFRWGTLEDLPFLPRVVHGRLVLSRARWRLFADELATLVGRDDASVVNAFRTLRAARELPRYAGVSDGDNVLPFDLDDPRAADTLAHLIRGRSTVDLVEMFPAPDELAAHGPEGRFVHELVVPFVRSAAPDVRRVAPPERVTPPKRPGIARSFAPGSEWLSLKLYGGAAAADGVLRDLVAPLVAEAAESGAADAWFYLRYADPDPHLRVRLHGDRDELVGRLLPAVHDAAAPFIADGRLWRLELDTYEREVERYGGPRGIVLSERVFEADSDAAVELLEESDADPEVRWRLTLVSLATLLADLGFELEERHAIAERARAAYAREHAADAFFKKQLGDRFRVERGSLEALLEQAPPAALGVRSRRVAAIARELREAEANGELDATLPDLAASYLHMSANRLLRSAARAHEAVLYDFIARLFESRLAKARRRDG
ncbi:MAG TPA: lantibiotic dehydratase [Polyangiaceae bacterium]|nr:lantibiotic dehydratase [Polyangiaceae bacterium]